MHCNESKRNKCIYIGINDQFSKKWCGISENVVLLDHLWLIVTKKASIRDLPPALYFLWPDQCIPSTIVHPFKVFCFPVENIFTETATIIVDNTFQRGPSILQKISGHQEAKYIMRRFWLFHQLKPHSYCLWAKTSKTENPTCMGFTGVFLVFGKARDLSCDSKNIFSASSFWGGLDNMKVEAHPNHHPNLCSLRISSPLLH